MANVNNINNINNNNVKIVNNVNIVKNCKSVKSTPLAHHLRPIFGLVYITNIICTAERGWKKRCGDFHLISGWHNLLLRMLRHLQLKCCKSSFCLEKNGTHWGLRTQDSLISLNDWPHFHSLVAKFVTVGHIYMQHKRPNLQLMQVTEIGTNTSHTIWWPNLEPSDATFKLISGGAPDYG